MPNETKAKPQLIPISAIHDLPGMNVVKMPDSSYGGLVTSIQSKGVQEPVILRLREDREYELVAGYRRRKAAELAKLSEVPAHVYDMSSKEALEYAAKHRVHPDTPIPGKLLEKTEPEKKDKAKEPPAKEAKSAESAAKVDKAKETPKEKAAEVKPAETAKKAEEKKPAEAKADKPKAEEAPAKKPTEEKKVAEKKPKEVKAPKAEKNEEEAATGPAAVGPTGTSITKVLESRLTPPGEKDLKALPEPKENEAFSVMLHPGYLEKAE